MKKLYLFIGISTIFLLFGCSEKYKKEIVPKLSDKEKCLIEKNGESCSKLARTFIDFEQNKVVDAVNFLKWSEKGCEFKSSESCYFLAYYYSGDGLEINEEKRKDYLLKACKAFNSDASRINEEYTLKNNKGAIMACLVLTEQYFFHKTSKDLQKALDTAVFACDNGSKRGCLFVGKIYKEMGDEIKAEKQYDRNCFKMQETLSCINLIEKYLKTGDKDKVDYYYSKLDPFTVQETKKGMIAFAGIVWKVKKDIDRAVFALRNSIELNFLSIEEIESDKTLEEIRNTEEYKKLIRNKYLKMKQ